MSYCQLKSTESRNNALSLLPQICDNTLNINQAVGADLCTSDLCSAKDDEK